MTAPEPTDQTREQCEPHDDLTEQTLIDGVVVCATCRSAAGIEQPPVIEDKHRVHNHPPHDPECRELFDDQNRLVGDCIRLAKDPIGEGLTALLREHSLDWVTENGVTKYYCICNDAAKYYDSVEGHAYHQTQMILATRLAVHVSPETADADRDPGIPMLLAEARKAKPEAEEWFCRKCGMHRDEHAPGGLRDECALDPYLTTASAAWTNVEENR